MVGPRDLDFIALEYLLGPAELPAFVRGYTAVLELPSLTQSRPIYRYLYRLLGVQGAVDIDQWLERPALF